MQASISPHLLAITCATLSPAILWNGSGRLEVEVSPLMKEMKLAMLHAAAKETIEGLSSASLSSDFLRGWR